MKILGFDLGDGESAVAILEDTQAIEPRMIPINGQISVLSAVGIREGRIVVGEEASVLLGTENTHVRFKSRYLTDPEAGTQIRTFAQGIMNVLLQSEPALMAQVKRTVVGCPAGWGERRREVYAALMESAGFPNVSIVPESRAAFLYARHARGLRVDPSLMQESAMVIDMGSSTTDFAYIVDGHQQDVTLFGDTNLGGGVLDEILLERSIAGSREKEKLRHVMEESPAWRSYCELEARRLKEQYFLNEEKWEEVPLRKKLLVCYEEPVTLELSISGEDIREIIDSPVSALGGRSFKACLQDALRAAATASRECPPRAVILTGGASRMHFFQELCRETFSKALMVLCPEPECSIARGLCYCGRVDENLAVFRKEVASIAHGDLLTSTVNANIHALYTPIATALYESAKDAALDSVALWRRGGVETIDELDDVLSRRIADAISGEDMKKRLEGSVRVWLERVMGELEGKLTDLCLRCGVPAEHMSLSSAHVETGVSGVSVSLTDAMGMNVLTGIIGAILAVVGATICGGSGVALVGTGPVGMATGAIVGILIAMIGKAGFEKMIRQMKVPKLMRQMVTDAAVKRGMERQRENIECAAVEALADPRTGFASRLSASLASTLGVQMEQMAKDAEMSITA